MHNSNVIFVLFLSSDNNGPINNYIRELILVSMNLRKDPFWVTHYHCPSDPNVGHTQHNHELTVCDPLYHLACRKTWGCYNLYNSIHAATCPLRLSCTIASTYTSTHPLHTMEPSPTLCALRHQVTHHRC